MVITKDIGGQALLTNDIQNYPGYPEISGFELMIKLQEQASLYGAEFLYDEVISIDNTEQDCFTVKTHSSYFNACSIILAFGKTPRDLGVLGEQELKGRGVSYCAVCDGPLFKGKTVTVVGSGDPSLEATNYLSGVVGKVYLIQRTAHPIGEEDLIQSLRTRSNVEFANGKIVSEIRGEKQVQSVLIEDVSSKDGKSISELKVDAVFVEMGYVTKTDFLKGIVQLNGLGEIVTDKDGKTTTPGIFAAGDVTDIAYKQAVISAGQGAAAALSAYNHVQKLRGRPASRSDWKSLKMRAQ